MLTLMGHHANIVRWQFLRERCGVVSRVLSITPARELEPDRLAGLFSERTRLLALTHVSNVLGTVYQVVEMVQIAHRQGIPVLIDGAQAVPHLEVDVQVIDCDFYCFSGHKMLAPTSIDVPYGKEALLDALPPYQGQGEMIRRVSFEKTDFADPPHRFEAGAPHIAGAVGRGVAIDYLEGLDRKAAADHERHLLHVAPSRLRDVPGLRFLGETPNKVGVVSLRHGRRARARPGHRARP